MFLPKIVLLNFWKYVLWLRSKYSWCYPLIVFSAILKWVIKDTLINETHFHCRNYKCPLKGGNLVELPSLTPRNIGPPIFNVGYYSLFSEVYFYFYRYHSCLYHHQLPEVTFDLYLVFTCFWVPSLNVLLLCSVLH